MNTNFFRVDEEEFYINLANVITFGKKDETKEIVFLLVNNETLTVEYESEDHLKVAWTRLRMSV